MAPRSYVRVISIIDSHKSLLQLYSIYDKHQRTYVYIVCGGYIMYVGRIHA